MDTINETKDARSIRFLQLPVLVSLNLSQAAAGWHVRNAVQTGSVSVTHRAYKGSTAD